PQTLCNKTTPNNNKPVAIICVLLPATTLDKINEIAITEIKGKISTDFSATGLKNFCTITPKIIGINNTRTTEMNISINDTCNHSLANKKMREGVTIGASNVDNVVIETDKAVFALAK